MAASIYDDKLITPDDKMLANDLGETYQYLIQIQQFIADVYGSMIPEWKYYNSKIYLLHLTVSEIGIDYS